MGSKRVSRVFMVFISLGVLSGTSLAQPDDREIEQIVKKRKVSLQLPTDQLPSHQPQQVISSPLRNDPQWSFLWNPLRAQHGPPAQQGRLLFFPMPPHSEDQHPQQTHEVLVPQPLWNGQPWRPQHTVHEQMQQHQEEDLGPELWWSEGLQDLWRDSMRQSSQGRSPLRPLNGLQRERSPKNVVIITRPSGPSSSHQHKEFKEPLPNTNFKIF